MNMALRENLNQHGESRILKPFTVFVYLPVKVIGWQWHGGPCLPWGGGEQRPIENLAPSLLEMSKRSTQEIADTRVVS